MSITLEAIFSRCKREGDCMVWQLGMSSDGRPLWHYGRHSCVPARKLVLELRSGEPMPPGRYACAACDTPGCVEHVKALTRKEQMALASKRGRLHLPERTARMTQARRAVAPKMNMQRAQEVRDKRAKGATLMSLGDEYGIHFSMVDRICRGKAWVPLPQKVTIAPPMKDRYAPESGFERAITSDWVLRRQGVDIGRLWAP